MRYILIFVFILCLRIDVQSQDIHFSDFYASPLNLNPGLSGLYRGNYRVTSIYRWQYGTVTVPYQTFSLGFDIRKPLHRRKKAAIGYGVLINYDITGDSKLGSYQFGIPLAVHIPIPTDKYTFSIGFLPEIIHQTIDYSRLRFPDQFVGDRYEEENRGKETFDANSETYFNVGSGVYFKLAPGKKTNFGIGFSVSNITSPKHSYADNNDAQLNQRYSIHSLIRIRIVDWIDLIPSSKFQFQGKQKEFQFGGILMHYIDNISIPQFNYGIWFRSRDKDAIILNAGFNINNFVVGCSYDINVSKLKEASSGHGAFEISLQYIYNKYRYPQKHKSIKCPTNL